MCFNPASPSSSGFPARTADLLLRLLFTTLLCMQTASALAQSTCPDLSPFYADPKPNWFDVEQRLAGIMGLCLDNSEYFALIGAAQLNSGQLSPALESLERALLINPDNGAAQVDYAQTLFELGQLFGALELNKRLLDREDLPTSLLPALEARQRRWRNLTRESLLSADLLAGHDSNLNDGPDSAQITLTPSGEPVLLALSTDLRPVSGAYLNLALTGRFRQLAPNHQHNVIAQLRGRVSKDKDSDLVQAAAQYAYIQPSSRYSWQAGLGMNHLLFGGSPLFSGAEASFRAQASTDRACKPTYDLAIQHQYYHTQSLLNGVEAKIGGGLNCELDTQRGPQQLSTTVSALRNEALKHNRLGGDRNGWQILLDWRQPLFSGEFRTLLSFTKVQDATGYSPLLSNGADRWQQRGSIALQYSKPLSVLSRPAALLVNLYHQRQRSNIELFRTTDSTAEIGFSWRF
jgi:tetratricopeptide (TPR) repeat protein